MSTLIIEFTEAHSQQRVLFSTTSTACRIACLTIALLLAVGSLGAQAMESLVTGARIRVLARDTMKRSDGERQFAARFVGVERDSLVVSFSPESDRYLLPLSEIISLDVSVSRRSARRGALVGAGYGALVGASLTAAFLVRASGRRCDDCFVSSEAGVLINGVPLTVLASAIGAIVFSHRQDKWRRLPLESLRTRK